MVNNNLLGGDWNHGIVVIIIIDNMLDYHYGILLSMITPIMMNDDIITIIIWLVVWNHGIL